MKTLQSPSYVAPSQEAAGRRMALPSVPGKAAVVFALACICLSSAPSFAQKTNNDYFKGAGTELLRNVEKYHLNQAADKLRSGQFESASGDIEFILRFFPNHPQGLILMTQLCEQWKFSAQCNFAMVSEVFENAIAVNPNVASTYVLQGIYLDRTKRLSAAVASFEKAVSVDPNSLNAHYNLGLAYFETKQFELANVHAQRAYQLGAPLPGLRDKLIRTGNWKPVNPPTPASAPQKETFLIPPLPNPRINYPMATSWQRGADRRWKIEQAGVGPSAHFTDVRSRETAGQAVATLRMLRRRRAANRPGVRSHGVNRGSWYTSTPAAATPHAVETAAEYPASRTMRTCSGP